VLRWVKHLSADFCDRDSLRTDVHKLSQHASVLSRQLWRNVAKGWENRIHTFHSKLDTMMEGIENDDLSLQPVEQGILQQIHILMMMRS